MPAWRPHLSRCPCVSEAHVQDIILLTLFSRRVITAWHTYSWPKALLRVSAVSQPETTTSSAHLNTDPNTGAQTQQQGPRPQKKGVQTWKQSPSKQTIPNKNQIGCAQICISCQSVTSPGCNLSAKRGNVVAVEKGITVQRHTQGL